MAFFITEATNNKKMDLNPKKRNKPRNDELTDPDDYIPKRFGLKYDPPMIVLEYMVISLGKLYHHKMKLLRLKADSDVDEMVDYLYSRHSFYLKESVVGRDQIANLVTRLQKRLEMKKENKTKNTVSKRPAVESNPLSMKKVDSKPAQSSIPSSYLPSVAKVPSGTGWDDGGWGEDDGWGDNYNKVDAANKDYNTFDMNKLNDEDLAKEKAKMDVEFEKHQKKPEDNDFVYDVRQEFKPATED